MGQGPRSGDPICSGITALAKPANNGVAKSSSMIVTCMVNNSFYCSRDTRLLTAWASSALLTMAISPAITKYVNDVMR